MITTTSLHLIDTHCHLDAGEFDVDRDAALQRARDRGVNTIVVPSVHQASFASTLAMRERYGCPIALGLHPVYERSHRPAHLSELAALIEAQRPHAVGEIGLDLFATGLNAQSQLEWLTAQLKLASTFDLPVLLHVRKAQDQVLAQLRRFGIRRGIAHAFNGSPQQADAYIKQGLLLGFGGNLTYPRAQNIRRLAAALPLESIVLETDAPDMPPEWARQQRNEPAYLERIALQLAELRGESIETIAQVTTSNAANLLGLRPARTPDTVNHA
ncbi:TatD family hydrolase [Burkholderiaceae bacterium DAT-1]|nr:TatD family hydrolase [Burkholderiaceae bacterium DAT-1]